MTNPEGPVVELGKWKSKTSDLVAVVERVNNGVVWYRILQWTDLCPCRADMFIKSMEKLAVEKGGEQNDKS